MNKALSARGWRSPLGKLLGKLLISLCLSNAATLGAQPRPKTSPQNLKSLQATLIQESERPKLDGLLSDPAWGRAQWSGGFVERSPSPGAPPPVKTELGVLFDGESLFVGVKMETRPDERPVAWELRRDRTSMWSDDAISIKLDPRSDQRTSLVFVTNPAGAQLDFIALDNGAVFSVEHDSIWEVKTSIQADAWIAEYRIPISSLLISDQSVKLESIGLNASRDHNARQATDDWSLLAPEFGPFSALHYGRVEGLKGLKSARLLTLTPYGALKAGVSPLGAGLKADIGLGDEVAGQLGGEFKLSLSHSEWLEGTALTDFAQVDLDDPLINLNRFALYFPERRPFFINGLDIFSFGRRGRSQLFFSRRVGLTATGEEVPITGGLKLYGRRGSIRYGALTVLADGQLGQDEPARLFNVARSRFDWGKGGSIGLIMVNRTAPFEERGDTHYGLGVDGRARLLDTRLELTGFYGLTHNEPAAQPALSAGLPSEPERGSSAGLELSWRSRNFRPSLSLEWVEADFNPVMGFTYRKDFAQASTALSYSLYSPTSSIRSAVLAFEGDLKRSAELTDSLGDSSSLIGMICHVSNWCLMSSAQFERDEVTEPFERAGLQVEPRRYDSWIGLVSVASPQGRRLGVSLNYLTQQGYFGGSLQNLETQLSVAFSPHLRLSSALNYARFEVEGLEVVGDGLSPRRRRAQDQVLGANLQLFITPSPTVMIDTVTQINSSASSLTSQARLRWRYLPGSDLFLVFRRAEPPPALLEPLGVSGEAPVDWRLTLKVSWRFDQPL